MLSLVSHHHNIFTVIIQEKNYLSRCVSEIICSRLKRNVTLINACNVTTCNIIATLATHCTKRFSIFKTLNFNSRYRTITKRVVSYRISYVRQIRYLVPRKKPSPICNAWNAGRDRRNERARAFPPIRVMRDKTATPAEFRLTRRGLVEESKQRVQTDTRLGCWCF